MFADWTDQARFDLKSLRGSQGNWSYKKGGTAGVEPSVFSALGLLASGNRDSAASDLDAVNKAAKWAAGIQHSDGSLPVLADIATPAWATPYAMLLWRAVPGFEQSRIHRALYLASWPPGPGHPPATNPTADVIGHDPMVRGWPWVLDTHSWVEPTALATLALCQRGLNNHGRVKAGIHLLLNRSLESGGWNYGNPAVLGRALRAQPGPSRAWPSRCAALQGTWRRHA